MGKLVMIMRMVVGDATGWSGFVVAKYGRNTRAWSPVWLNCNVQFIMSIFGLNQEIKQSEGKKEMRYRGIWLHRLVYEIDRIIIIINTFITLTIGLISGQEH